MNNTRINAQKISIGSNYVLPIEQSKVTVQQAKVQQIIEATDAQAQQIISGAEGKSQEIIDNATKEAQKIIEAAQAQAQSEYEAIKKQGYDEGFEQGKQDGLNKFKEDTSNAIDSLATLADSSFDIKHNIIDSASLDIVELVSVIADKVCHIKFDTEVLYKLTVDAIKELSEKEEISLIVNPILVENINSIIPDIRNEFSKIQSIKIKEDNSISPDGVIVETLSSRLDARISSQIEVISQKMITGTNDELE